MSSQISFLGATGGKLKSEMVKRRRDQGGEWKKEECGGFLVFELMFLTKQQRIDQLFVYRKKHAKWCKFSEEATVN